MQNANPQSEQQATNLQQTLPIQSKSTQPTAVNPNQLNPGLSLEVEGAYSQASAANSSPPTGILWPVIVIVVLIFVAFVGVLFTLMKAGRADPLVASEEADITELPKSKPKTKKKPNKSKRRR